MKACACGGVVYAKGRCRFCYFRAMRAIQRERPGFHERAALRQREHRARRGPLTQEQNKANNLKSFYGLTLEAYRAMLDEQGGRCGICDRHMEKLCVDHCHKTGEVRGLLCQRCNGGLGQFADSPDRLARAIGYLRRHADAGARKAVR